jgi:hypothetical protein
MARSDKAHRYCRDAGGEVRHGDVAAPIDDGLGAVEYFARGEECVEDGLPPAKVAHVRETRNEHSCRQTQSTRSCAFRD